MTSIKIFAKHVSGTHDLERTYFTSFSKAVESIQQAGGYYTKDNSERDVFVPWHQIAFIRKNF